MFGWLKFLLAVPWYHTHKILNIVVVLTIGFDFMLQLRLYPFNGKSIKFYRHPEITWHLTFNSQRWYRWKNPHVWCVRQTCIQTLSTCDFLSVPHFVCHHTYSCHWPNSDSELKEILNYPYCPIVWAVLTQHKLHCVHIDLPNQTNQFHSS